MKEMSLWERERGEVSFVFPGIAISYHALTAEEFRGLRSAEGDLLEIHYCYEGSRECQWSCGDYLYLGAGDLCMNRMDYGEPPHYASTENYRGVTIILALATLEKKPLPVFTDKAARLVGLADKFCPGHHFFAMRANDSLAHIFNDLYHAPGEWREDYVRIKLLELLLFLCCADPLAEQRIDRITRGQIEAVKAVRQRLCEDLSKNYTIEQLAKDFCISPTALKSNFRLVYKSSVKEYLRKLRMDHAALLLRTGNRSIADIALASGYGNQSKFASAFRKQYGLSPMEYRRKCEHPVEDKNV